MNIITSGQVVLSNPNYVTSDEGTFGDYEFVLCSTKDLQCSVMFLAIMVLNNINELNNESSI
jgi:hypothetical protein